MVLSIITINYNNCAGLEKTLKSVEEQVLVYPSTALPIEIEHVIVDGGSTDGSVEVIREYEKRLSLSSSLSLKWISEKDKGIYNAMNKGIRMASGEYIQILNSGDVLASEDVIARMAEEVKRLEVCPDMVYGNMIKRAPYGRVIGKSGEVPYSLLQYFVSTMNHDCCWIRRSLFINENPNENDQCYGLYDENLKIVSDWKWFLQAIGLGQVKPVYVDIDMTIFDSEGISEKNLKLRNQERRQVLEEVLPKAVLADYDKHAFDMQQMDRLRKHHLYGLVYFMERVLFKLEKWHLLK